MGTSPAIFMEERERKRENIILAGFNLPHKNPNAHSNEKRDKV